MHLPLAVEGVLIGLSVAAPIGPMSMLTMRRAIERGFLAGSLSGLGIALADASYATVAAVGLSSLSNLLVDHQQLIRIAGGIALLYIGASILRSARTPATSRPETLRSAGLGSVVGTMYVLTLSNPTTILSFAAIFGGLGVGLGNNSAESLLLVLSVFLGSMLWWLALCGFLSKIRTRLNSQWVSRIDLAAGAIILVMAFVSIAAGVR
jgi:threonine/homoserine/homoserine lactone efflux protein